MPSTVDRAAHGVDALDSVLIAIVVGLAGLTGLAVAVPGLRVGVTGVGLDLIVDTITAVVAIAASVLMWARYRERHDPPALVQAGALLVLAISNSLLVGITVVAVDTGAVATTLLPGQGPLYLSSVSHLLAAGLLVVGLRAALRGATTSHPWATLAAPVIGILVVVAILQRFGTSLPALSSQPPIPITNIAADSSGWPSPTPLDWIVEGTSAALCLVAAMLSRRLFRQAGTIGDAYLAVALVFGGFSRLYLALVPGSYPGLVSGGDLLRLGFDVALLLGIEAGAHASLADLRRANERLVRLKDAEIARSTLEERARLARELHDGLSQDLWLAKLKVGRLASIESLSPEAATLSGELGEAIDAGLADARQAVIALRTTGDGEASFSGQLSRYVDDFADQSGLQAELTCDPDLPPLAPRATAELLRIAQEALTNVRRHADATVVRLHATVEDRSLRLGVVDNGRGFDPAVAGTGAYGLASMRERAALIGGRLTIESHPLDGTGVWIVVPLPPPSPSTVEPEA